MTHTHPAAYHTRCPGGPSAKTFHQASTTSTTPNRQVDSKEIRHG